DLYSLSLHDALPISSRLILVPARQRRLDASCVRVLTAPAASSVPVSSWSPSNPCLVKMRPCASAARTPHRVIAHALTKRRPGARSEEHTSELQSRFE